MGVGAPNGAGPAVQQKAHGALLAGTLGVEVHKNDLLPDLFHVAVGDHEGVVGIAVQGKAAHQVQHANIAEGGLERVDPPAGTLGREVCRTQDLFSLVQVGLKLRPCPGVVAQGDHIRAGTENGVRLPGRDSHNVCVFPVDHHKIYIVLFPVIPQALFQKAQPRFTAYISHRQNLNAHISPPARNVLHLYPIIPQIAYLYQWNLCT